MIITDEKLDLFMVCWADWCCQGGSAYIKGYPRRSSFTHEKIDAEFGSTLLVDDSSDLEEIERYVKIIAVDSPKDASALRAHYEAGTIWQNLKATKKCKRLNMSERCYRGHVSSAKRTIKALMQNNKFHSRMLA